MDDDNFTQWLIATHAADRGPLGNIVEMAKVDRDWPHTGTRLKSFLNYVAEKRLPPSYRIAMADAWADYRSRDRHW